MRSLLFGGCTDKAVVFDSLGVLLVVLLLLEKKGSLGNPGDGVEGNIPDNGFGGKAGSLVRVNSGLEKSEDLADEIGNELDPGCGKANDEGVENIFLDEKNGSGDELESGEDSEVGFKVGDLDNGEDVGGIGSVDESSVSEELLWYNLLVQVGNVGSSRETLRGGCVTKDLERSSGASAIMVSIVLLYRDDLSS